ncbi:MAG: aldehyde dehydrogenase family protein [Candidatus Thorarchaeota archaeon]
MTSDSNTELRLFQEALEIRPSTRIEMDSAIEVLQRNKDRWIKTTIDDRIKILDESIQEFGRICDKWVTQSALAKGDFDDPYSIGMEWIGGPVAILRSMRGYLHALYDISNHGNPKFPGPVWTMPNGQVAVKIYPSSIYERLVTLGLTVEVWMEDGISEEQLEELQAVVYKEKEQNGSVVLVLGGGNVSGISVNDSMYKLFVENQVVLLKMHPVNEYLGPLIERCLSRLIGEGFLQVVYGGVPEVKYMCEHPSVNELHMTGSDKTFETIMFGTGEEGIRRKKENQPLLTKRFTTELGNIAPAIIVPGPWSESDFNYQAEQLVSHLCDNASFSCSRSRVILQHSDWPKRIELLQSIGNVLEKVPLRTAYYPGSFEQHAHFLNVHPEAEQYGIAQDGQIPWTLISGVNSQNVDDICFRVESFCPVIAESTIDAPTVSEYIRRAVDFSNEHLWGTLSATIVVHPKSLKDPEIATAIKDAVSDLRYGIVTINGFPGVGWAIATPPWGSFPGNQPNDIQSGTGFVHNSFMFSNPQKTVIRAPFRMKPKPVWFNSRAKVFKKVGKKMAMYELNPSLRKIPGMILAALRG